MNEQEIREIKIVRVKVIVTEDDVEVDRREISYYVTQPYEVAIATPDGPSANAIAREAGAA